MPEYKTMTMKGEKDFKPHKMYCKDGSVKDAKTFKDHLKFKKMGCGHTKKEAMAMKHGDDKKKKKK
jgi:hypothetical protein